MGFGSSIKGFDWDSFGYLLDSELSGAGNSFLSFLIEYSWDIAFVLGMVALAFAILQMITAQEVNIITIIFKIVLTVILISYYEPICKGVINYADEFAATLSYNTNIDIRKAFLEMADERAEKAEELYQRVMGSEDLTEEQKNEIMRSSSGAFNPYKLSLFDFNPLKFLASILLILCQVAIVLIEKFRNIIIALLIVIGRFCVAGVAWEKTEGFAKGWFFSLLNAASWTIWLAFLINLQQASGFMQVFSSVTTNERMIDSIANCVVFLLMYLQVFGFAKELMAGSLGAAAASIGSGVATGIAGKYMAKGMMAGGSRLGRSILDRYGDIRGSGTFSYGSGLTQMDPSVRPVKINDFTPLPPPQTGQITGDDYIALPAAPQPDFYGGDDGISSFSDEGPIIDADYTVIDD